MNAQEPIVKKGTKMTRQGPADNVITVIGIRRNGVECILENGRLVMVNFQSIEQAVSNA